MTKERMAKIETSIRKLELIYSDLYQLKKEEDGSRLLIPKALLKSEKFEYSEECSYEIENAMFAIKEAMDRLKSLSK